MKTIFILTYCILINTKVVNTDVTDCKTEYYNSYQEALDSYNEQARSAYLINPNILKAERTDTLMLPIAIGTPVRRVETVQADSVKRAHFYLYENSKNN